MKINKKDIGDIIKQIIAGILIIAILSFASYLLGFWPSIVNFLKNSPSINNGLLALVIIILLLFLFKKKKAGTNYEAMSNAPKKENPPTRLEKIQEDILLFLSHYDGKAIYSQIMLDQLNLSVTKLKYHLEELKRGYYIRTDDYGNSYYIAHPGRSYLIKNKLINT